MIVLYYYNYECDKFWSCSEFNRQEISACRIIEVRLIVLFQCFGIETNEVFLTFTIAIGRKTTVSLVVSLKIRITAVGERSLTHPVGKTNEGPH